MFSYAASQRLPCAIETCGKRFTCTQCVGTWNHTVLLSYNCVDKRFIEQFHWTRSVLLLSLLYFDLLQVDSPSATGLFPSNKGSIIKFLEQVRRWRCFFLYPTPFKRKKKASIPWVSRMRTDNARGAWKIRLLRACTCTITNIFYFEFFHRSFPQASPLTNRTLEFCLYMFVSM